MADRPILFSAPMVRALLAGTKTQTRRPVTWRNVADGLNLQFTGLRAERLPDGFWVLESDTRTSSDWRCARTPCPYGQPGDRLWGRETWGVVSHAWDADGDLIDWTPDRPATRIKEMRFGQGYYSGHAIYAADGSHEWAGDDDGGGEPRSAWHPSIHMPRAASRILLEITAVRVERLQDISREDAMAEGIVIQPDGGYGLADTSHYHATDPRHSYWSLWEAINGPGSVEANPWVWAVTFQPTAPTS